MSLPDGSEAAVFGLRNYPPLTPWAPLHELRVLEADGELRWSFTLDTDAPERVELVTAGPEVLLVREKPRLHALELSTGELLWSRDDGARPDTILNASALGTRIFIAHDNHIRAYDRASGELLWSTDRGRAGQFAFLEPRELAPFGEHQITAGRYVLDAATGAARPPIEGFSCRTESSLLTCGDDGCRRRRLDGSESVLTQHGFVEYASCFEARSLLVAVLSVVYEDGPRRDSVALASFDEITTGDTHVLAAWDEHDRLRWARAIDSVDESCLLVDGRLKITRIASPDGAPRVVHTRYYDLATGEFEYCVGIDDCPGYVYLPPDLARPGPGERACRPTRAVGQE